MKNSYLDSLKLCYPIERVFNEVVENLEIKEDKNKYPDSIFYFNGDEYFANYNEKNKNYSCHYDRFWLRFKLNNLFEYPTIKYLLNPMIEKYYKLKKVKAQEHHVFSLDWLEECLKPKVFETIKNDPFIIELIEEHFKQKK